MVVLVIPLWGVLLWIIREILPVVLLLEELQVRVLTEGCMGHSPLGCVALHYQGNLACGTSTEGRTGKSIDRELYWSLRCGLCCYDTVMTLLW